MDAFAIGVIEGMEKTASARGWMKAVSKKTPEAQDAMKWRIWNRGMKQAPGQYARTGTVKNQGLVDSINENLKSNVGGLSLEGMSRGTEAEAKRYLRVKK